MSEIREVLEKCSKDEIIEILCADWHYQQHPIKYSDVLYIRWEKACEVAQILSNESMELLATMDAVKQDELCKALDAETDTSVKLDILIQMHPYYKQWDAYLAKSRACDKARGRADAIYRQLDKAQAEELHRIKEGGV